MVIKSKIFIKYNAKEFNCWNFSEDLILNFNV